MKHLLDFQNIQKKEMENLIEEILKVHLHKFNQIKSLTLLQFNENSTRTRLSFAIAAKRLGIDVVESTDNISAKSKQRTRYWTTNKSNIYFRIFSLIIFNNAR